MGGGPITIPWEESPSLLKKRERKERSVRELMTGYLTRITYFCLRIDGPITNEGRGLKMSGEEGILWYTS